MFKIQDYKKLLEKLMQTNVNMLDVMVLIKTKMH